MRGLAAHLKNAATLTAILALSVGLLMLSNLVERNVPLWRPLAACLSGVALSIPFFFLIVRFYKMRARSIVIPRANSRDVVWGFVLGLGVFAVASAVYYSANPAKHILFHWPAASDILGQALFQVRPALIEEIGFRLGLAGLATALYGRTAGWVAGSIPFGLLHLLNFATGEPIMWDYIIGTTAAGLFLTTVYFNFDLTGAIATHFTWNVFASLWAESLTIPQEHLEGAPATLVILIGASALLWLRKLRHRQSV